MSLEMFLLYSFVSWSIFTLPTALVVSAVVQAMNRGSQLYYIGDYEDEPDAGESGLTGVGDGRAAP